MGVLVGKPAPDFKCSAVTQRGDIVDDFTLSQAINSKYGLLFFYPLNFTFVCPSELLALHNRMQQFKALNVEVMGISVDSKFSHLAWRETSVEKGGIGHVDFTLLSDITHHISRLYDVEMVDGISLRAAVLIDRAGIVQSAVINTPPLGRNIDEILRIVEALQFHEQYGEVCPAGWKKGQPGMKATTEGVSSYLKKHATQL